MGVKQYKPTSPGRRFQTVSDFAEITTSTPEKSLLAPLSNKAGRNNNGRITTRHQGGGNKRRYRIIDFKRNKDGVPAKVATIEYDPNRSARIALLHYVDGEKRYILHPKGLRVGDTVMSGVEADMLAVGLFCGWALSGPRAAERFAFITGSSISSFELPDGSRITLDKESRLEYDGDFGRDERNVRLVGKGFFEVEKMPDKRFVVEMGDVQVSVLGTTFDASNRTEEGIVSASLVEGSVAFRAGNQNLRLTPSRRAVYHVGSGEITVSEFDPEITTAWKDNLFRYKSLTLEEVLEQLSARYDVRIITDAGDVGRTRFSGALETRLSVEQALDIVSRQTGMEWSKLDNVYFVAKR